MPREVIKQWKSFGGGVNLATAPDSLADDELLNCLNMLLWQGTGLNKRPSFAQAATTAHRVLSMAAHYGSIDGVTYLLMHLADGQVRAVNTDSYVQTQLDTGNSTSAPFSYAQYGVGGSAVASYFSNGVDDYAKWDGSAWTTYATAPKGKYLKLWKDIMWVANITSGGTDYPSRIWASNAGDPSTFGVASWIDIAPGDGDVITGLATDGNVLIVFKRRSTYVIYDPVEFSNKLLDPYKGSISHRTIIGYDGGIYFMSDWGFHRWVSDGPADTISDKIQPLFAQGRMDTARYSEVRGYALDDRIGWIVPNSTDDPAKGLHTQIEFYPKVKNMPAVFCNHWIREILPLQKPNGLKMIYGASSESYTLRELTQFPTFTNEDGTYPMGLVRTSWTDFDAPMNRKYLRTIRIVGRGQSVYLKIMTDYDTEAVKSFQFSFPGASTDHQSEVVVNTDVYGHAFCFEFYETQTGQLSQIIAWADEYAVAKYEGKFGIFQMEARAEIIGTDSTAGAVHTWP